VERLSVGWTLVGELLTLTFVTSSLALEHTGLQTSLLIVRLLDRRETGHGLMLL
jgi:hypothetical protein